MKASNSHKGPYEFDTLQCVQEMHGEHLGPIWCMKFSPCGRLLATAGQDRILRIWVLKSAFNYFQDMRSRCNADNKVCDHFDFSSDNLHPDGFLMVLLDTCRTLEMIIASFQSIHKNGEWIPKKLLWAACKNLSRVKQYQKNLAVHKNPQEWSELDATLFW